MNRFCGYLREGRYIDEQGNWIDIEEERWTEWWIVTWDGGEEGIQTCEHVGDGELREWIGANGHRA